MKVSITIGLALSGILFSILSATAQDPAKDITWYITHCPFPMQTPVLPSFPDRDFKITADLPTASADPPSIVQINDESCNRPGVN